MDRGAGLNVVNRPVSWLVSFAEPRGTEENGSFLGLSPVSLTKLCRFTTMNRLVASTDSFLEK